MSDILSAYKYAPDNTPLLVPGNILIIIVLHYPVIMTIYRHHNLNLNEIKPAIIKLMRITAIPHVKLHVSLTSPCNGDNKAPLSASENYNRPLYEILESDYGIIAQTSKEEISAAAADSFIASKLEIKHGVPILVRKRYVFDINNNPIEYNVGCYRADSFTYTIESRRSI